MSAAGSARAGFVVAKTVQGVFRRISQLRRVSPKLLIAPLVFSRQIRAYQAHGYACSGRATNIAEIIHEDL